MKYMGRSWFIKVYFFWIMVNYDRRVRIFANLGASYKIAIMRETTLLTYSGWNLQSDLEVGPLISFESW